VLLPDQSVGLTLCHAFSLTADIDKAPKLIKPRTSALGHRKRNELMSMFCYQCEQTSQGTGCTTMGICGKTPETTVLQDLLVYQIKGISQYAHRARQLGKVDAAVNSATLKALFVTLTNVNFDSAEHLAFVNELGRIKDMAASLYTQACAIKGMTPIQCMGPSSWSPTSNVVETFKFAESISLLKKLEAGDQDIIGLQELLTYGIKGLAAYAHHAEVLGYTDDRISAFVHEAMNYLCQPEQNEDELLNYCLKAGEVNYLVMELLDKAHTDTYGHPEPTQVRTTPVEGKCILVSGHDMRCLYEILRQTEGKNINVYTHGELLPAHGYPAFKQFTHLVGNYGGAWQNQVVEFNKFPGAIVMTTNCLKPPSEEYRNRLFTVDAVGFNGITKIGTDYDFSKVIESCLNCDGFTATEEPHFITVGFARNAVLGAAEAVVGAIKKGRIKHFFLVGGCDGAEFARNYYTEFAEKIPSDCVILTLGCAKFRFNMEEFGDIDGIPRLLDLGQCNDAYSAIKIASALADAFECGVNDLPLSIVLSWLEQKAVAVLLTLLWLGIKDMRIGPSLPAFITPRVLDKLVKAYGLKPISTPAADMEAILATK
jgi:hydroxylamine reductase